MFGCSQRDETVNQPYQSAATAEVLTSNTTTPYLPIPTLRVAYPVLDPTTVSGKVVYQGGQKGVVIMDANGVGEISIDISGDGIFDSVSSPIKWSPDGQHLAMGCQNSDKSIYGVCILDLAMYFTGTPKLVASDNLKVIQLPSGYSGNYLGLIDIVSLEWSPNGKYLILTPFCVVDVEETYSDCSPGFLEGFSSEDRALIKNSIYIIPSKNDDNVWVISSREKGKGLSKVLFVEKQIVNLLKEAVGSEIAWSHNEEKIVVLGSGVTLIDIASSKRTEFVSSDELLSLIDPRLLPKLRFITQDHRLFLADKKYMPRQSLSWSPDDRYVALTVFYENIARDDGINDQSGIFYLDTQTGDLIPVRANFSDGSFSATPDWYACDDPENVCDLYK